MKNAFLFALLLLLACNNSHHGKKQESSDAHKHAHKHHETGEHKHGSANEFMHQSPVAELIERFEAPERDTYQQPDKVMAYLGDISDKKIMDIGAGSGYFSVRLAEKGAAVIAADVDDEFLAYIEKRTSKAALTNIETRKIPYDAPSLKEQEVDMVLIVNTYHHIENRTDYFSKVKAGLRENGELVVIDFFAVETPVGPKHHKIAIDTVVDELKKAGFTSFEVEVDLLPYQYLIKAK